MKLKECLSCPELVTETLRKFDNERFSRRTFWRHRWLYGVSIRILESTKAEYRQRWEFV